MKGTFFRKPFEFQLQVKGESWRQGDAVEGSLITKVHSGAPSDLAPAVHLALGDLKKVRQKSGDAFRVIESARGAGQCFEWRFAIDRNGPISDSGSSLFLLYGNGDESSTLGQLQITVVPAPLIQEFVQILETEFRFAFKSSKALSCGVEMKLSPPQGKAFALVENLVLKFRFDDDALLVENIFQVKKFEASATGMSAARQKRELKQTLRPGEHFSAGRLNQGAAEKLIREALALVESKILF